jgi:hypothetical protein
MQQPTDRIIFQNAWVVPDIEQACMKWVNEMGVGPFFISESRDMFDHMAYRGKPAKLDMIIGLAQAGPMQIELIQPLVDTCAYHDSVPVGQMGFHHMCAWTEDIEADTAYFADLGYPAANRGGVGDLEFAYYDTRPLMGCMLEVVTRNERSIERFAMIKDAAIDWDGSDPVRR